MSIARGLRQTAAWLEEHRQYVDWQVHEGYDSLIDGLRADAERVETLCNACQRIERALEAAGVPLTGAMGGDGDPPMMRLILRRAIGIGEGRDA